MVLHALGGSEVYLQGDAVRHADIRWDTRGLAVLNALNRVTRGYEEAEESTRQELALAESQLKDFQTRQGAAFTHDAYLKELSALREQLKVALSDVQAKEGESASDIAGRIKALRCHNSVEPAPEREMRAVAADEPVTAIIRRKTQEEQESIEKAKWQQRIAGRNGWRRE